MPKTHMPLLLDGAKNTERGEEERNKIVILANQVVNNRRKVGFKMKRIKIREKRAYLNDVVIKINNFKSDFLFVTKTNSISLGEDMKQGFILIQQKSYTLISI